MAERAAPAQEGGGIPPALQCSEQAAGTPKCTQVKEALEVALSVMHINTSFPLPLPCKCLCCTFDAFLEKVKRPLICEMTQETLITSIPEASAGFAGDEPWLS